MRRDKGFFMIVQLLRIFIIQCLVNATCSAGGDDTGNLYFGDIKLGDFDMIPAFTYDAIDETRSDMAMNIQIPEDTLFTCESFNINYNAWPRHLFETYW